MYFFVMKQNIVLYNLSLYILLKSQLYLKKNTLLFKEIMFCAKNLLYVSLRGTENSLLHNTGRCIIEKKSQIWN